MRTIIRTATSIIVTAALVATAHAQDHAQDYAKRDGKSEAATRVAEGKPAIVYTHVWNGRAPGFRTPGLRNCDPRYSKVSELFVVIPELGMSEPFDIDQMNRPAWQAAYKFALAFNKEMYRLREGEILSACPNIVPE